MLGAMLARIAILSLLAATLCPATLIYELRLTGTVRPGASVNTRLLNGSTQLKPLDNARVEVLIELDFDLRPPVVINDLGGGALEYLYASTAFSPEWITRVRFTFLDFPVFSEPHLPISNVWELTRMPAPPRRHGAYAVGSLPGSVGARRFPSPEHPDHKAHQR